MCKQRPVPAGHGIALVITFLSNCTKLNYFIEQYMYQKVFRNPT